jgi:hypothetical protein
MFQANQSKDFQYYSSSQQFMIEISLEYLYLKPIPAGL